jgi:hypothetical protein
MVCPRCNTVCPRCDAVCKQSDAVYLWCVHGVMPCVRGFVHREIQCVRGVTPCTHGVIQCVHGVMQCIHGVTRCIHRVTWCECMLWLEGYKFVLRNEFIFLFVDWSIHPKKKWRETASLRVAHDAKFPSFFFRMDTSSTSRTNKFIPYHLIISKIKYYGIKRYIFHDLFMQFSFCDVWVVYDVWVLRHRSMD